MLQIREFTVDQLAEQLYLMTCRYWIEAGAAASLADFTHWDRYPPAAKARLIAMVQPIVDWLLLPQAQTQTEAETQAQVEAQVEAKVKA